MVVEWLVNCRRRCDVMSLDALALSGGVARIVDDRADFPTKFRRADG
jgi:hypothetical protein